MIKKNSEEWNEFIRNIESIKLKSNRQVLCVRCWVLLNYEQKIKHLKHSPDHEPFILTSSKFASAWQISSLALSCKKVVVLPDGEYVVSPFQEASPKEEGKEEETKESPHSGRASKPASRQSNECKFTKDPQERTPPTSTPANAPDPPDISPLG